MIRFLFVNLPFSSHVNPTPDLVRELTQAGHHVTYVLAKELHEQLEGTGAALVPYDNYDSEWLEARRYVVSFERAYETAKCVGKEKDFDCLVHEAVFVFGNQLAEDLNLPRVRFFSTFAFNHGVLDRILETGGVHFNLFENGNPIYKLLNGYFDHVKGMMQSSDVMNEIADHVPDLNITYTSRELQYLSDQFDEERFYFVGPPINEVAVETAAFDWEQMTRPIIYIAMGTMIDRFSKAIYDACFEALADADVTVIASVGDLEDSFDELPENVFVYSRVPQIDVLRHVDLFITHGGMNSVNEAIYAGVPMLVNPIVNDQIVIAEQIEHLNIGKRLDLKDASSHDIRTAVFNLLSSESIASHIQKESQNMQSLGGNEKVAELIIDYMQ